MERPHLARGSPPPDGCAVATDDGKLLLVGGDVKSHSRIFSYANRGATTDRDTRFRPVTSRWIDLGPERKGWLSPFQRSPVPVRGAVSCCRSGALIGAFERVDRISRLNGVLDQRLVEIQLSTLWQQYSACSPIAPYSADSEPTVLFRQRQSLDSAFAASSSAESGPG